MLSFFSILLLIAEIGLIASLALLLHHLSGRVGLAPLSVYIGALTALLQFNAFGMVNLSFPSFQIDTSLVSFTLLPVILLGVLVVYAVDGTLRARSLFWGILVVTLFAAAVQILPSRSLAIGEFHLDWDTPKVFDTRIFIASTAALVVDQMMLVIVFQALSNLRRKFPSRLAGSLALLAALCADALIFPTLALVDHPQFGVTLLVHLLGKTCSGLLLSPLIALYLIPAARRLPDSAAPRPVLDFFTTAVQYEERARYQHALLRIRSDINQLIVRSQDSSALLQQACQLLAEGRHYPLCFFDLWDSAPGPALSAAHAGAETAFLEKIAARGGDLRSHPLMATLRQDMRPIALEDLFALPAGDPWREAARQSGLRAALLLPARHAGTALGVMAVFSVQPGPFDKQEIQLLQELADDLAYACNSLSANRQQAVLRAAAETMQDGVLIADLDGQIAFVNRAVATIFNQPLEHFAGKNIFHLLPPGETQKLAQTYRQALLQRGSMDLEFEIHGAAGRSVFVSVRGTLVHDPAGQPAYAIAAIGDITQRRRHEHQLLTLNRIITELVQLHDAQTLFPALLQASEELLDASASALFVIDSDTKAVTRFVTHQLSDDYARRIAQDYRGLPGDTALRTRKTVCVEDVLDAPEYGERIHFMAEYGIRSLIIIPITYQGLPLGALTLYFSQPRTYTEADEQLGQTLSHTLAIAIENSRLYEAERSQRQLAEALEQAAASLNRSLNLDEVLGEIIDQTCQVTASRFANIFLIEGKAAYLARSLGYDGILNYLGNSGLSFFPLTFPSVSRMLQTRQPLLIADTSQDAHWTLVEGSEWIASYAAAPLLVNEDVVGFLQVDSEHPGAFTTDTIRRLQAFAAHAAIAIQNARLFNQLQQYAAELENRVRQRTSELRAAKERMEGILASVPDAVFVLDDANQLLQANQAGETLLAQAYEQDIDLFPDSLINRLSANPQPADAAIIDFRERSYQALASNFSIQQQKTGHILVFRDVTHFRQLDRMKNQFVSDVSHELRTPLTNLTIYLDLLADTADPEKRRVYLDTLRRETGRLTHLIEDLLTISRLEAGRMSLAVKPVDIRRLLLNLAQDRVVMAANQGLHLWLDPAGGAPLAYADARLLNQCISNLLTNAIHYTPSGGSVRLQVGEQVNDQGRWVVVSVADSGVGIAPEELPHIFERFYRGAASRAMQAPGTGLGLAIAREIAGRMNAHIQVESALGQGSVFTVWLRAVL